MSNHTQCDPEIWDVSSFPLPSCSQVLGQVSSPLWGSVSLLQNKNGDVTKVLSDQWMRSFKQQAGIITISIMPQEKMINNPLWVSLLLWGHSSNVCVCSGPC